MAVNTKSNMKVRNNTELWKFIKFNISVLLTSALDILSYLFLLYFVFAGSKNVLLPQNAVLSVLGIKYKGYLLSYIISTTLGYVAAYLINRKITFHSDVNPLYSSVMYFILAIFNILVSSYIGSVFGSVLEMNNLSNPVTEAVAKFIIINIPTLWTYPLERYVIQINKRVSTVKYIATDLDGTLLSSDTNISNENLEAIERLSSKQINTILLTGRTLYEVPNKLRNADGVKYIVFSDGAGIWSREKGIIKYEYFPLDTAREIFDILSQYETFIEVYSGGKPLVESEKLNSEQFNYYHIDSDFIPEMFKSRCAVESLAALFADKSHKTELFDVFFKYETEKAECEKRLKAVFGEICITSSMTNNLEICPPGVSKGAALTQFCGELGIDIRNVAVAGDSPNDISAFKTQAKKYAVSNACCEVKNLADKVICSNDENIMCYFEKEFA